LACVCLSANAHSPHDAIDALRISPDYENDSMLFIVVQNSLLQSTNRGATWKQLVSGLDSPHLLSDIAVSPNFAQDNTLFVSTDGGGVYASPDRGQTWHRFNNGLRQLSIGRLLVSADQDYPAVLAAGSTRGLFVSHTQDAGWQRAISDDVQITALRLVHDNSSTYALAGDSTGGLWKSSADLKSWQRIFKLEDTGAVTSLARWHSPGSIDTLFLGTEKAGLLSTADGGLTFEYLSQSWPDRVEDCRGRKLSKPVKDLHIRDIEIAPTNDNSPDIHVTTWTKAVHVSRDAGKSWEIQGRGISCDPQADQDTSWVPHYRDLEFGDVSQTDWFLAGFNGLFRSEDSGESWVQLETLPVSLIRGFGISPANDSQHALAVTTYGGGAYVSVDQGESWSIANNGLVTTRLADVEFSPDFWTDGWIFSLASERLLSSKQIDMGWTAQSLVYKGWRRRVGSGLERRLGFSPDYGTRLFLSDAERRYLWPMQIELSPAFSTDQTMLVGFRKHGVWKSENAGVDWNRSWDGPIDYVTALQVSPDFPNDGTAFAGIRGSGVYVSHDGAETWHASNAGFQFLEQVQVTKSPNYVVDPPLYRAIKDVLLVISPRFTDDHTIFASSASGLFRSNDGGQLWENLTVASSLNDVPVIALGISPAFGVDDTIVVSFKGRGLYRSTDGGATFESVGQDLLSGNFDLEHLQFSPTYDDDNVIYGATDEVVLKSQDRGDTWSVLDRPVRYENWRGISLGPIIFTGDWTRETGDEFSASTQSVSVTKGARASLNFFGSHVVWRGERGPDGGKAKVLMDGVEVASVNLYSERRSAGVEILSYSALEVGPHNMVIENIEDKSPDSVGFRVSVDAIDLLQQ